MTLKLFFTTACSVTFSDIIEYDRALITSVLRSDIHNPFCNWGMDVFLMSGNYKNMASHV